MNLEFRHLQGEHSGFKNIVLRPHPVAPPRPGHDFSKGSSGAVRIVSSGQLIMDVACLTGEIIL